MDWRSRNYGQRWGRLRGGCGPKSHRMRLMSEDPGRPTAYLPATRCTRWRSSGSPLWAVAGRDCCKCVVSALRKLRSPVNHQKWNPKFNNWNPAEIRLVIQSLLINSKPKFSSGRAENGIRSSTNLRLTFVQFRSIIQKKRSKIYQIL